MITLAYLDARTLLDRSADVRHPSPVARSVHRWVTAWTIATDVMDLLAWLGVAVVVGDEVPSC